MFVKVLWKPIILWATHRHTPTHPYTCMHTKQFSWSYPRQKINLPPETLGCQIKSPKHDISSLVVDEGCSRDFPKQYIILPVLLVAYQNLILKPYCWGHHIFWSHGMGKSNWYWLRSFLPIGQLSEYWKSLCKLLGKKVFNGLTKLWTLWTTVMSNVTR